MSVLLNQPSWRQILACSVQRDARGIAELVIDHDA